MRWPARAGQRRCIWRSPWVAPANGSAPSARPQQGVARGARALARRCQAATLALAARHGGADGVGMRCLPKAHGLLEAGGPIQVAAVGHAVARVDGVVDAASGFLGAVADVELADGSPDGLCGALLQARLVDGGGTSGQERQGGEKGCDGSKVHKGLLGMGRVQRVKQLSAGTVARLADTADRDGWMVGISSPSRHSRLAGRRVQMAPKRVLVTVRNSPQCAARPWFASDRAKLTLPSLDGPARREAPAQSLPPKVSTPSA